jgi:hypothetical protein
MGMSRFPSELVGYFSHGALALSPVGTIHSAKVDETLGWFPLIPPPLLPEREQGSRKSFPLAHFGKGEHKG